MTVGNGKASSRLVIETCFVPTALRPRAVFSISDAHVPRTSAMTIQCTEKGQEGCCSTLCPVGGCESLWTGKQPGHGKRQIRRILSCSCALFSKFAIEVCRKVILHQAECQPLSFKLYALYPLFFRLGLLDDKGIR
jgi:hypothetical protein